MILLLFWLFQALLALLLATYTRLLHNYFWLKAFCILRDFEVIVFQGKPWQRQSFYRKGFFPVSKWWNLANHNLLSWFEGRARDVSYRIDYFYFQFDQDTKLQHVLENLLTPDILTTDYCNHGRSDSLL